MSAAIWVFLGGSTRYASPGASFLLHPPKASCIGTAGELRATAACLERDIVPPAFAFLSERTGADAETVAQWNAAETTFDATTAKTWGVAHDIRTWPAEPIAPTAISKATSDDAVALDLITCISFLSIADRNRVGSALLEQAKSCFDSGSG